jgi:Domain of unknown function (DUF4349)
MTPDTLLEDLDLALDGHPAADRDLLALVADVRAQAPQMSPQFSTALDESVSRGFAAEPPPSRAARRGRRLRWPTLYVLAPVAAAAAVAVVVIGSGGGSNNVTRDIIKPGAHGQSLSFKPGTVSHGGAEGSATRAPKVSAATPVPAPEAGGVAVPQADQAATGTTTARKVVHTTDLTLRTPIDELQEAAAGVVHATQQAGGFVASSQVQVQGSTGSADFTLRIPSAHLEPALTALTHLGKVTSMNQTTQDVTGNFSSAGTRLARLQTQQLTLRRRKQTPIVIVKERQVAAQIAAVQRELSNLRHSVDYVTVNVAITGKGHKHHVAPVHHGSGFTPGKALHAAGEVLVVAAGVAIIALIILIPIGLLAGAIAYTVRVVRRRNRESALKTT